MSVRATILRAAIMLTATATLGACVSIYRNHGYVPTETELSAVVPGRTTRAELVEAVGTPGTTGVLNEGDYYYVETRFRHYGARAPQPVSRQLLAIDFDGRDVVQGIERYDLRDGRVVPLERRVTDSAVQDNTFLRQLIGNLGNFTPGQFLEN